MVTLAILRSVAIGGLLAVIAYCICRNEIVGKTATPDPWCQPTVVCQLSNQRVIRPSEAGRCIRNFPEPRLWIASELVTMHPECGGRERRFYE